MGRGDANSPSLQVCIGAVGWLIPLNHLFATKNVQIIIYKLKEKDPRKGLALRASLSNFKQRLCEFTFSSGVYRLQWVINPIKSLIRDQIYK